jgi:hypothetical protein
MRTVAVVGVWLALASLGGPNAPGAAGDGQAKDQAGSPGSDNLPALVLLTPGTKVGDPLPAGWNHLVVESIPKLESGDVERLPAAAKATATTFRTVVLADVRRAEGDRGEYGLRRVGLGLCLPVDGVDTVVSPANLDTLPISAGRIPRRVIGRAQDELARGRLRARTATFALYSTPAEVKKGDSHVPVLLRYALLVDPATGALHSLVWSLDDDPESRRPPARLVVLAPSLKFECRLDVTADRLLETVPSFWSFAMNDLPPGRPLTLTPELESWVIRDRLTPTESAGLEAELRLALSASEAGRKEDVAAEDAKGRSGTDRQARGPLK